jgi:hypothetical protein
VTTAGENSSLFFKCLAPDGYLSPSSLTNFLLNIFFQPSLMTGRIRLMMTAGYRTVADSNQLGGKQK